MTAPVKELELISVTKRYGATVAVDAIDHKFQSGGYACLLGPSGCGKSSTLRMIAGHEIVSDGSILLGNDDISSLPPAQRGTAMMFQNYALFPHLSVADNVAFSLKMRGEAKMRGELRKLQRELGITFIHVTHGQDEALALADEIVVMNNAVIEQAGTARDVFNAPTTAFVAQFIGGHNVIALPGGHFAIRTDAVGLSQSDAGNLQGSILAVEYQGAHVSVVARIAGDQDISALVPEAEFFNDPFNPGDQVGLIWDDTNLHKLTA